MIRMKGKVESVECWCIFIDDYHSRPRDAVRAIKKRFQQCAGKNHNSVMYTLTVSDDGDISHLTMIVDLGIRNMR